MESFTFTVAKPIKQINFKGIDYYPLYQESVTSDDTDIIMDEQTTADDQVEILEKALEQTRENAFQAGYIEGRESSLMDMESRIKELSSDFTQLAEGLKDQYKILFSRQEKTLLNFSMRIAEKILHEELTHKKEITDFLSKMLKKTLIDMMEQKKIKVFLNSEWLNELNREEFLDQINLPLQDKIQFQEDEKLQPGDCLVESEDFFIDATLVHQLELIEKHLNQEYLKWN
ncbi:MAG: FliH/SctL family protein [Candidatus Marinimicrobia bacterium]|jgi:flagellar biosynthesis/type III secretory pathway protein FliH|nr:FliH/SctL family protein [Candidatus Neomarinimicrobiota bacterium]